MCLSVLRIDEEDHNWDDSHLSRMQGSGFKLVHVFKLEWIQCFIHLKSFHIVGILPFYCSVLACVNI